MDKTSTKISLKYVYLSEILNDMVNSLQQNNIISKKTLKKNLRSLFTDWIKSTFEVKKNPAMNEFLRDPEKCLREELTGFSKTIFITNGFQYLGFLTIRILALDINNIDLHNKKPLLMSGKSPKDISHIPCYFIEQVGKNIKVENNNLHGEEIVDTALEIIESVNDIIGSTLVILYAVDVDKVKEIYAHSGFKPFGERKGNLEDDVFYQPMYVKLPSGLEALK